LVWQRSIFLPISLREAGKLHLDGISMATSIWGDILSVVPEVLRSGSILLNNYIDAWMKELSLLMKFAACTKLGEVITTLKERNEVQYGLDSLEKWLYKTGKHFQEDKCKLAQMPWSPRTVPWAFSAEPCITFLGVLLCSSGCDNEAEEPVNHRVYLVNGKVCTNAGKSYYYRQGNKSCEEMFKEVELFNQEKKE
jgi:hypothetical protein